MPRKPIISSDNDTWGGILNDYLDVSHEAGGELKPAAVDAAATTVKGRLDAVEAAIVLASPGDFPFRTARDYGPTAHPAGAVSGFAVAAVMATVANRHARYAPFYVPETVGITQFRFAVAAGAAGGLIRAALYSATVARTPSALLHNYGTYTATAAGEQSLTFAELTLPGPAWYVGVLIGEATAEGLQVSGRQGLTGIYGVDSAGFPAAGRENLSGITSMTAPATWAYATADLSTFVPRFELRVA